MALAGTEPLLEMLIFGKQDHLKIIILIDFLVQLSHTIAPFHLHRLGHWIRRQLEHVAPSNKRRISVFSLKY